MSGNWHVPANGWERWWCTLTAVPAGGGTAFDIAGFDLRPRRGSAVYFGYGMAGGRMDLASLHKGMPVGAGEKWIATVWLRERAYRRSAVDA